MTTEPSAPSADTPHLVLRQPSHSTNPTPPQTYNPPPLSFLSGTWHVTHSTLPMWKTKRNVRITYTLLPPSLPSLDAGHTNRLDDLVEYQSLDSSKQHTVRGIDKAANETADAWDWRGKGWLMIASSHWEVLGWSDGGGSGPEKEVPWAVTFFAKTMFTPAGVDVYSRDPRGLREGTVQAIKDALARVQSEEVKTLAGQLFEIKRDDGK